MTTPVDIDLPLSTIPDTQPSESKFKKVHTVIEMGGTTNYMGELVQIKKNLFLHAMQYLEIVLFVGYYALLIPFRISADGEGYKLISHPAQGVLTCTLLAISTGFQLLITHGKLLSIDVKNRTEFAVDTAENAMTVVVMITYLYTFIIKRHRFISMFERFNVNSSSGIQPNETINRQKRFVLITCTFAFLLALANWTCWGHSMLNDGVKSTINEFYRGTSHLKSDPCDKPYTTCYYGVGITALVLELHKHIVKSYVELIMWGCGLCLYNIEIKANMLLIPKDNIVFDIKKAIDIFRIIKTLVQELCFAMGPITVAYYMEIIPYWVSLSLSYNNFQSHLLFIAFFKLGHILLTAESNANANNLVDDIRANRITCNSENIGKVTDLQNVMNAPIALRGMDFFTVTYPFLGSVGLSVFTYCILVVELQQTGSLNNKVSFLNGTLT